MNPARPLAAFLHRPLSNTVVTLNGGIVLWALAENVLSGRELAPVDSNHHSRIQSPVSCRWTRGQRATI